MSTTIQILLGVFTVAGYAIGHLHAWMASPIGAEVMKAAEQVVATQKLLQGHAKLQALAQGGIAVANSIPAIDAFLHAIATGKTAAPTTPSSPNP